MKKWRKNAKKKTKFANKKNLENKILGKKNLKKKKTPFEKKKHSLNLKLLFEMQRHHSKKKKHQEKHKIFGKKKTY